jgi:hypothetical protein
MATAMLKVEQVEKAGKRRPALYLVKDGERIVGLLEKYRNTRTDTHPWKAFSGHGTSRRYIGAFYDQDFPGVVTGGKPAALEAIQAAS